MSRIEDPIAIVGMSCRLPGASNPAAFWNLVEESRVAVGSVPESRWKLSDAFGNAPELAAVSHAWRGGFLDGIADVDWRALRLLPREAKSMDPQHRLLLELAWEAMEDAGIPVAGPRKEKTGVYVGIQWNDFFRLISRDWHKLDGYSVVGNDLLFASNRISFALDLAGPSMSLDCGCASGLVALQQGCRALWAGDVDQVVVGAVDMMLSPDSQIAMAGTGMLSKLGACRPLDEAADGFVRGEGGVVLVLKLQSRVGAHERVHALIGGAASAHSGRNEWIMASSASTQARVIREACSQAGVSPTTLDYVELHGTGSQRGDPVELRALGETVGAGRSADAPYCAIGSVKAQIGHLGPVAGLVGLVKVVLGMRHQRYPRSWKPETVNPAVDLESAGLTLDRNGQPWCATPDTRRRAGVTALSLGGVAAHVVLEEPLACADECSALAPAAGEFLLPISARSRSALVALARAYADTLDEATQSASLLDLCFTAGAGRSHHDFRLAVCGESVAEVAKRLREEARRVEASAAGASLPGQAVVVLVGAHEPKLADACVAAGLTVIDEATQASDLATLEGMPLAVLGTPQAANARDGFIGEAEAGRSKPERFVLSHARGGVPPMTFWAWVFAHGGVPDFAGLFHGGRVCTTPAYPWQRQRMWPAWLTPELIGTPPDANGRAGSKRGDMHPILGRHMELAAMPGGHVWHTTAQALLDAIGHGDRMLPLHAIACTAIEAAGLSSETLVCRELAAAGPITTSTEVQTTLSCAMNRKEPVVDLFLRDEHASWIHVAELSSFGTASVAAGGETSPQVGIRSMLSCAHPSEAKLLLRQWVDGVLLQVLQPHDGVSLGSDVALNAAGLDSIAAAEIRTLVQRELSLDLPVAALFDAATPDGLCAELLSRLLAQRLFDHATTMASETLDQQPEDQETWTL